MFITVILKAEQMLNDPSGILNPEGQPSKYVVIVKSIIIIE
jgi:hypothetical protein